LEEQILSDRLPPLYHKDGLIARSAHQLNQLMERLPQIGDYERTLLAVKCASQISKLPDAEIRERLLNNMKERKMFFDYEILHDEHIRERFNEHFKEAYKKSQRQQPHGIPMFLAVLTAYLLISEMYNEFFTPPNLHRLFESVVTEENKKLLFQLTVGLVADWMGRDFEQLIVNDIRNIHPGENFKKYLASFEKNVGDLRTVFRDENRVYRWTPYETQ